MQGHIDRGGLRYGKHIRNHLMTEPAPYVHRDKTAWDYATEVAAALALMVATSVAVVFAVLCI